METLRAPFRLSGLGDKYEIAKKSGKCRLRLQEQTDLPATL